VTRAFVTGCAGFIGSHLTEALLEDGYSVVGVDCFNSNYGRAQKLRNLERATDWEAFEFLPLDLSRGELHDLIAECDLTFHLAAEPGVRASWGSRFEAYLRNNVLATQHMLEAAKEHPEKRFVYASSSSIYGQAERFPTPEDAKPAPLSPYGVTKLGGEHLCGLYRANHGVETVCLRYFSVYGPRQRPDMAFHRFCLAAIAREPISIYGDGEQTRDFTFVADVVEATRAAATTAGVVGGIYNIGGGSRIKLSDALSVISDLAGGSLEVEHSERVHGDVRDTGADTTRARDELGFRPATPFEQGLREEFEWLLGMKDDERLISGPAR
jgi:nucleoside-diphosphate-sugar epimerase